MSSYPHTSNVLPNSGQITLANLRNAAYVEYAYAWFALLLSFAVLVSPFAVYTGFYAAVYLCVPHARVRGRRFMENGEIIAWSSL